MKLDWLEFVILVMATWRISSLLVKETGPFKIFSRLRELTGIRHDENDNIFMVPDNLFAGILSCVWCCSVWAGIGMTVLYIIYPPSIYGALALALSASAIVVEKKLS